MTDHIIFSPVCLSAPCVACGKVDNRPHVIGKDAHCVVYCGDCCPTCHPPADQEWLDRVLVAPVVSGEQGGLFA